MKKRYISLLFIIILTTNCSNVKSINVKRNFKKTYPKESFYFIDFEYSFELKSTTRYHGILYSKSLKNLRYPKGINMGLKTGENGSEYVEDYEELLLKIKLKNILKEKIKGLSIESFYVDTLVGIRSSGDTFKKILLENKRTNLRTTNVYIFVENLDEISIEDYKKKLYDLTRFIDRDLNIATSLNFYIKDDRFFENYESLKYQIFPHFREEKDIKKILNKVKTKEKLSSDDKTSLIEILSLTYPYDPDNIIIDVPTLKFNINTFNYRINIEKYYYKYYYE